jgi:hypothetical protein
LIGLSPCRNCNGVISRFFSMLDERSVDSKASVVWPVSIFPLLYKSPPALAIVIFLIFFDSCEWYRITLPVVPVGGRARAR